MILPHQRRRLALLREYTAEPSPHAACGQCHGHGCCLNGARVSVARAEVEELRRLPAWRRAVARAAAPIGPDDPCPLLENGRCSVYAARPLRCRVHHSLNSAACVPGGAVALDFDHLWPRVGAADDFGARWSLLAALRGQWEIEAGIGEAAIVGPNFRMHFTVTAGGDDA